MTSHFMEEDLAPSSAPSSTNLFPSPPTFISAYYPSPPKTVSLILRALPSPSIACPDSYSVDAASQWTPFVCPCLSPATSTSLTSSLSSHPSIIPSPDSKTLCTTSISSFLQITSWIFSLETLLCHFLGVVKVSGSLNEWVGDDHGKSCCYDLFSYWMSHGYCFEH